MTTSSEPRVAARVSQAGMDERKVQRCLQNIRRHRKRARLAEEFQAKTKRAAARQIKELRQSMAAQSRELGELHLAEATDRR